MTTEVREKIYAEKTTKYFGDIGFCVPIAEFADEFLDMIDARDKEIEKLRTENARLIRFLPPVNRGLERAIEIGGKGVEV